MGLDEAAIPIEEDAEEEEEEEGNVVLVDILFWFEALWLNGAEEFSEASDWVGPDPFGLSVGVVTVVFEPGGFHCTSEYLVGLSGDVPELALSPLLGLFELAIENTPESA